MEEQWKLTNYWKKQTQEHRGKMVEERQIWESKYKMDTGNQSQEITELKFKLRAKKIQLDLDDLKISCYEQKISCHNGFPLDLDDLKNKWSHLRSFLYESDRSPRMHILKLGTEIPNLNTN